MDPFTVFVTTIVLTLLNGAVLGFMHRDVSIGLRESALRWRVGTLVLAAGLVLLATQRFAPPWLAVPLANVFIVFGVIEYWRSLEHYDGRPRSAWFLGLAAPMGVLIWVFLVPFPDFALRSAIASATWCAVGGATLLGLWRGLAEDPSSGRRVLVGIYAVLWLSMLGRCLYFLVGPGREQNVLDSQSAVNALSPLVASVLPIIGTTAFLLMCSDRLRRQLERTASTDALTDLANRRTLTLIGNESLARARATSTGLAVAIVDVDHFKSVNDRFGHEVGDLALKHVASRLRAACRADDLPARQGGEEFVVLFQRVDAVQATAAAERLRMAIASTPVQVNGAPLSLTASLGVAALRPDDLGFDDLLRRADQALYRAKSKGRDRVELAE